uniref:fibrocystin-L-like isoform X4 n=1 Tax=Ciona intestinalis TaxID=7719 RepID=UPI000EF48B97|nr:fibrocystin-L-like isoform X4 [Ciona intestinalis]|eukprot:XP_026692211.1 fibrocystin-L-like isoform X4 [Ciona intestinalis]
MLKLILTWLLLLVNHATSLKVRSVSPRYVGNGGAVRVTVFGEGFLESEPNFAGGDDPNAVKVYFIDSHSQYECDVGKEGSTKDKIICYTRPMPQGNFFVKVVSGNEVAYETNCNNNPQHSYCTMRFHPHYGPDMRTVSKVEPIQYPISKAYAPGDLIQVYGRIVTQAYGSNNQTILNGRDTSFRRVYVNGHSCELINPDTQDFYSIKLTSETSIYGTFHCQPLGTYIGYSNMSFILTNSFGRSVPHKALYQVSGTDTVHMIQTYAEITGISPKVGSAAGGTHLTITGKHFDRSTKVLVGGVPCKITNNSITATSLTCVTGPSPNRKPYRYSGSRGIYMRWWNETSVGSTSVGTIFSLHENKSDYRGQHIIQQAGYQWNYDDDFAGLFEGIFVAPQTDNYKFYFKSDDAGQVHFHCGELLENETFAIVSSRYRPSYFHSHLQSDWISMKKGQQCYFKAAVVDWHGQGNMYIAAHRQKTTLTAKQSNQVFNEKQRIDFEATKQAEKQKISFNSWNVESGVEEKQTVRVVCTQSCSNSQFRLIYNGMKSTFFSYQVSRSAFESELRSVVGISGQTVKVTKTDITNGKEFVITFKGKGGDYPPITYEVRSNENMQVTVSETVKGVPDFKTFSIKMGSRISHPITNNASGEVLQTELMKLVSAHCSPTLLPSGSSVAALFNYEDGDITEGLAGQIKRDVVPFCGRGSLLNPSYIYKSGTTAHVSWEKHRDFSILTYPKICFAHRGIFKPEIGVTGSFQYTDNEGRPKTQTTTKKLSISVTMSKTTWTYSCFDFSTLLQVHYPSLVSASIREIYLYQVENFYIDALYIGKNNILPNGVAASDLRVAPALATGEPISNIVVQKMEPLPVYDVTIETYNCGHMVPLFMLAYSSPTSQSSIKVENKWSNGNNGSICRVVEATPPMRGTFDLTHISADGFQETLKNIQVNTTVLHFQNLLESLQGFGKAKVEKSGSCHEIDYTIEWLTNGGSKTLLQINTTNILGAPDLVGSVRKISYGGIFHAPIPGEMLRLPYKEPQVEVLVNNIPSLCTGNCGFMFSADHTPMVQSFTPNTGSSGTVVSISGSKFGTPSTANVTVQIGNAACVITSHTDTQLQCQISNGPAGSHHLNVLVHGLGRAAINKNISNQFNLTANLISIYPDTGFTSGGALLNLTGTGFIETYKVYVGANECVVNKTERFASRHILCVIPPGTVSTVDVSVKDMNGNIVTTLPSAFTYSNANLPVLTLISPTTSTVIGGSTLNITGRNLGSTISDVVITIAGKVCSITTWTSTYIQCKLPSLPHGVHQVNVLVKEIGIADLKQNNISGISYTFAVDQLSPQHGSIHGGSIITISGQGFVNDPALNILLGNHSKCNVQSVTSNMIQCKIGSLARTHFINNNGIHPVYGSGFAWNPQVLRINVGDKVVWRWNIQGTPNNGWGIRVFSTAGPDGEEYDNVGFNSGPTKTQNGYYEYKFVQPGTYHAFSGYINGNDNTVLMRGTIHVTEKIQHFPLHVKLRGISAHVGAAKAHRQKRATSCTALNKVPGCVPSGTTVDNSLIFVSGEACYTPTVLSTSPQSGTIDTVVTITGSGFAQNECANSVMIGNYPCEVLTSSSTEIRCSPKPTNMTLIGTLYQVKVTVNNLGEASVDDKHRFALVPNIKSVVPVSGSMQGGTKLTVTGFGFYTLTPLNRVSISGTPCMVQQSTSHQLTCVTSAVNQETSANITFSRSPYISTCTGSCLFSYLASMTPTVTSITPNTVNQSDTTITIVGSDFSNDKSTVSVTVGSRQCNVTTSSSSLVKCTLDFLPFGAHTVKLTVNTKGYAAFNPTSLNMITSVPRASITPVSGSIEGGNEIMFSGNGFMVEGLTVTIDGKACPIKQPIMNHQFSCVAPRVGTTKEVNVVISPSGFPVLKYTYNAELTALATSIQPSEGVPGEMVTITGTRLNNTNISVFIGDSICVTTFQNFTHIQCTVPSHRGGTFPVKLLDSVTGFATSNLMFTVTLNITSVTPMSGGFAGGVKLALTGLGFDETMQIKVCDNMCHLNASAVTRTNVECILETEPISSELTVIASVLHSSTFFGGSEKLTIISVDDSYDKNGYFPLGQIVVNNTALNENTKDIITYKGVTNNAFKHPSSYVSIYGVKRNDLRQYVSIWRPVAPKGYACLGDILKFGSTLTPPNLDVVLCPHMSLVVESTLGEKMWAEGSRSNLFEAWRIHGSRHNVFATKSNPKTGLKVYRLKNNLEKTSFEVDKSCPVTVTVGDTSSVATSNFTYTASQTPKVESVTPVRGGTGGGVNITIVGTGFTTDKSSVKVSIAGVVCTVLHSTETNIVCQTEPSSKSTSAFVEVSIVGKGLAINKNAQFQYVDLWSSIYTWGGLSPPTTGDLVVVKKGQTVVLDVNTPVLKLLLIQGGKLIFDEKNIELQAEYILITDGGVLQIGTEEKAFEHKAIITLHGHLRAKELPIYGAKVLGVRNGTLDLHGKHIPITWTHLSQTSSVGSTTLNLDDAVTWNVGDTIVVATTGHRHSQKETETFKITNISANKKVLTVEPPLKYEHIAVAQTFGDGTLVETKAEVGLLTRNIVIRGSKHLGWTDVIPECEEGFNTGEFATQTCFQGRFGEEEGSDEFGATIMLHPREQGSGVVKARIEFVEITEAGQAFRLGRYPIHFHLMGNVRNGVKINNYVRGCAIHKTFNRAVTVHGTHNLLVEHNVVYDVKGGALFIEDGVEIGNVLQYNLILFCKQSTSLQNDDITPAAIWATNPNNTIQHNAMAGGTHFGVWYRMRSRPDGPSYDPQYCPRHIPLGVFLNNTVHSQGWFGVWTFQVWYPKKAGSCWNNEPEPADIGSMLVWNCEKGAELVNAGAIRFHNALMVNNEKAGLEVKQIGDKNVKWGQAGLYNSKIIARGLVSKSGEKTHSGVVLPYSEAFGVHNVTFINFDQNTAVFAGTTITGTCASFCGGYPYKMSGIKYLNSPNKARFRWAHEMVIYDLDGSVTETNQPKVITPSNPSLPPSCVESASFSVGFKGSVCPGNLKFHRLAWNKPLPSSLEAKDVNLTTSYGTTTIPFKKKGMTHKLGWTATVITGESYVWTFVDAQHISNISYKAGFYSFETSDCVIMSHKLTQKPDRVQVYKGLARNGSTSMVTCAANKNGDFFFDANEKELFYVVSGSDAVSRKKRSASPNAKDRSVLFDSYRCFYKDCIIPKGTGSNTVDLKRERPSDAVFWSNVESWRDADEGWGGNDGGGSYSLPKNGAKIKIKTGVWMVADIDFPDMTELWIEGTLELDGNQKADGTYKKFTLQATHIIITGRLIIGWEDDKFVGEANIILKGDVNTPEYKPSAQINMGAKAIGVFGGLDLHGRRRDVVWTKLAQAANAGDSTVVLSQAVEWEAGEEIMVTSTSFDPWETETFKIQSISSDKLTLTLNTTLKFTHLAYSVSYTNHAGASNTYKLNAEVGLLSRNIKIIGQDYNNLYKESFGARLLVGTYQNRTGTEFRGFARIEDVEFYHTGQEGHIDNYDPRFSLAFLRTGTVDNEFKPSYVRRNSFHHGFNSAIGVFGAKGVPITNNVIHHTVGPAIKVEGENHRIEKNLAAICRTRSVYQDRNEIDIVLWKAAIEINEGTNIMMFGNVVAGSERAGYRIDGEECSTASVHGGLDSNEARAVMQGIWMNKDGFFTCSRITNFNVHKAFEAGIYYQGRGSVEVVNALITDSTVGLSTLFIGPASKSHGFAAKYAIVKKSTFVAVSKPGDCTLIPFTTDYIANVGFARAPAMTSRTGVKDGRAGVLWPIFMSGPNATPQKPHYGSISYSALGGRMEISETTFVNFDDKQCTRDRHTAFMTNPAGEDYMHPIYAEKLHFVNSSPDSRIFIHRPSLGKINPSDCVDMECDGMKVVFLLDKDGSMLGSPGSVIPEAEFEWDGDKRRGLGDYRIPKTMLTRLNGSRIPVNEIAPNKGILRKNTTTTNCVKRTSWRAHECHGYRHELLIIESLDVDSETRRLSPVALLTEGYIDLLNGPQDHGWCDGYTCQERLSTFHATVALNKEYLIHFSGTSPQKMRLRLPNVNSTDSVVVGLFYTSPRRLDVYVNEVYIEPLNAQTNSNGERILLKPTTPTQYKPTNSKNTGANYFDRDSQTLFVTVKGDTPVDIYTAPVVEITFGIPPVTPDEFFDSAGLIKRLALFLNVDESKIRIVDIVRVGSTSSSRKKRSTQSSSVSVEVGDPPPTTQTTPPPATIAPAPQPGSTTTTQASVTTTPSPTDLAIKLLQSYTVMIVNALQTGTLASQLNTTILSMSVIDALPPPEDSSWKNIANQTESGITPHSYTQPDKIQVSQEANAVYTHTVFPIQPMIEVVDSAGNKLKELGHSSDPWMITVSVQNKPTDVLLSGVKTVPFVSGVATFSGLSLNKPGTYKLVYQVTHPTTASSFSTTGREFSIIEKPAPVNPPPNNNTKLIGIIVGSVVGVLVLVIIAIVAWKRPCCGKRKSAKISCEQTDDDRKVSKYSGNENVDMNEYVTVEPQPMTTFGQSTSRNNDNDVESTTENTLKQLGMKTH